MNALAVAADSPIALLPDLPPHSFEAEMGLLGSLLAHNAVYDAVAGIVAAEHFGDPRHGRIFDAIGAMIERGERADPITLRQTLDAAGLLKDIGGWDYVARLSGSLVTVIAAPDYARTVRDLYTRRRMMAIGGELAEAARAPGGEERADDVARRFASQLDDLTADTRGEDAVPLRVGLDHAVEVADRAFRAGTGISGVATGLADLDRLLGGFQPSDFIVVAGRPAMGKTALAMTIAYNAAKARSDDRPEGAAVLVFSLEMSLEQLAAREISAATGIATDRQRRGGVTAAEIADMMAARAELARLPLYIDATPHVSIQALRSKARRAKRRHGIGLVVVDYLQLLVAGRIENRVQEVSKITRELKLMAKELGVPVAAVSQLSREVERRDDKRPMLSDLRESGSIEQDADVVVFVYRDEYYENKSKPRPRDGETRERFDQRDADWHKRMDAARGIAELIVDKNRHGPENTVRAFFDAQRTRFVNLHAGADPER